MTMKRKKRMTMNRTTMKGRKRMTVKRMTVKRMTMKRMTKYIKQKWEPGVVLGGSVIL
jgi:hypothetical protein